VQTQRPQFRADDLSGYLQLPTGVQGSRELSSAHGEGGAPMIAVRSLANDRKALAAQTHEIDRNSFPRGPADRFVSEGTATPGHDDRAKTVDAGGIESLDGIRAANAQGTTPNLESGTVGREELRPKVGDGMKG
jgi:hypothetical protein